MITPGFYTYWLIARDPRTNTVIWEGMLLAKEVTDDNGKRIALTPDLVPDDLIHALAAVPTYVTEWEPVWEVIDDKDRDETKDSIT